MVFFTLEQILPKSLAVMLSHIILGDLKPSHLLMEP